eukprot:COSAG04_NODE_13521_length_602_cov_1.147117_1_plen_51_part_10
MGQVSYLLVASKPLNRKTPYPRTARFRFDGLLPLRARAQNFQGRGPAVAEI